MERILDKLTTRADAAPDDVLLKDTITLLRDIQQHPERRKPVSWEALYRDFQHLQDRGLWERSTDNDELLDALRILLASPSNEGQVEPYRSPSLDEQVTIVIAPPDGIPSRLISSDDTLILPLELIQILNHAYFLHTLATDPAQALPPGKSLLSVMSRSRATTDGGTKPALLGKVEDYVHQAFWDEAIQSLSNPEPSAQLSRIGFLYRDLHVALSPLLPPKHPVLVTLSSPLSPTSSPLDSTIMHLREILAGLRERCAPARDPEIEALQLPLDDPPIRSSRPIALATLATETIRHVLKLSEVMKDDLSQFVLGSMTEQQLRSVVAKQAKTKERDLVFDIWRRDRMLQEWKSWLAKLQPPVHLSSIPAEPRFLWIVRIVQALGLADPIFCPFPTGTVQVSPPASSRHNTGRTTDPTENSNTIPPVFFFIAPTLLKIQNYLQALVIAASLGTLARLPASTRSRSSSCESPDPDSFMSRVWTLLHSEISTEPGTGEIKLINLADEVVRARIQATAMPSSSTARLLSQEDEARLRAAVRRTLRPEDLVFRLLQQRLLTELSNTLVKRRRGENGQDVGIGAGPSALRAGRAVERVGKRPRLVLDPEDMDEPRTASRSSPLVIAEVKGFEDPTLSRAIAQVFEQVDSCLEWVESVWGDIIETGNVKNVDSSTRKSG